jgi:hypothetical protein
MSGREYGLYKEAMMFRKTPNGCTSRNLARIARAGPHGRGSRGDPGMRLSKAVKEKRDLELEEIEKILFIFKRKEKKS